LNSIKELHRKLKEAYSDENLNAISVRLIELYKSKQLNQLRILAESISDFISLNTTKEAKLFSQLILLYHPDKGENIRKSVDLLYQENNFEALETYSHIFIVEDFDFESEEIEEDIDYEPEYEWEYSTDGFHVVDDLDNDDNFENEERFYSEEKFNFSDEIYERSVFNAIKIRQYGNLNVNFPTYYLHDLEELELADCQINSLEGIEHCIHTYRIDLSDNEITDLTNLMGLTELEELFLANNQIGYIDVLSNLTNLKSVDLSGNDIDDASPLFGLENLEYINLIDTKVPYSQIETLHREGRIVMT